MENFVFCAVFHHQHPDFVLSTTFRICSAIRNNTMLFLVIEFFMQSFSFCFNTARGNQLSLDIVCLRPPFFHHFHNCFFSVIPSLDLSHHHVCCHHLSFFDYIHNFSVFDKVVLLRSSHISSARSGLLKIYNFQKYSLMIWQRLRLYLSLSVSVFWVLVHMIFSHFL